MTNAARPTRNDRREEARERARILREEQRRRERRNRWFLQGGIVLAVIVVIGLVVALVIANTRPTGLGPRNVATDGVTLVATGDGKNVKTVTSGAHSVNSAPVTPTLDRTGKTVSIVLYADYLCPVCKAFEQLATDTMKTLVASGTATLEIHPVAILSPKADDYSTRAGSATACVADLAPESFLDTNTTLYRNQPDENGSGLTNAQITDIIAGLNPPNMDQIRGCISDQRYVPWVRAVTQRIAAGPIPNSTLPKLKETPTILVNGERFSFTGAADTSAQFKKFVQDVASKSYATQNETPAPSAT